MFTIFKKKKLTEDQLANFFVNSIVNLVEQGFQDVVEIINNDPEFVTTPNISKEDYDKFLLVVVAGNIKLMSEHFDSVKDVRITEKIYRKLGSALSVEPMTLKETIAKYQSWMSRINHPSKNTRYAMSKGVFFKYELNQFQSDYFRNMNTPNPIFLKRLDEVISQFLFNWNDIKENYRISS
ncbi:hypothetical protein N9545_04010 [Salibacteraceae bacterium]|jgi:hypothetical protein|nr:hypothetical protein [Salibacteraceae bacterium]MDB9709592.1 hypothetical protein [Salibacteraceae bacterium]MDC1304197.1 hypothetical protein [Salibacteraceae bacterium]HAQ71310.1 hypothetical protein [Flavobacteriales bacterium]